VYAFLGPPAVKSSIATEEGEGTEVYSPLNAQNVSEKGARSLHVPERVSAS
jgi:hypothetical protein